MVPAGVYANPCGGLKWRTLSDGRIELQDGTAPSFPPGSPQATSVAQTWDNWAPLFREAAKRVDVPVSWLVATAAIETGGVAANKEKQRTIASFDGSIGIMQPLASTAARYGYSSSDRYDAAANIDIGAKLLRDNADTKNGAYGFPVVAAMYNGGSGSGGCNIGNDVFNLKGYRPPGSTSARYAMDAIRYLNTAIESGYVDRGALLPTLGVALAGIGIGAAIWIVRTRRIR